MERERKTRNDGLVRVEAALEAAGFMPTPFNDARVDTAKGCTLYGHWVNPSDGRAVVLTIYRDEKGRCEGFDAFESITTENGIDAIIEDIAGKAVRTAPAIACVDALRDLLATARDLWVGTSARDLHQPFEQTESQADNALRAFDADPNNQGANGLDVLAAARVHGDLVDALDDVLALARKHAPTNHAHLIRAGALLNSLRGA